MSLLRRRFRVLPDFDSPALALHSEPLEFRPEQCHPQSQSPLFAVLPGEIRQLIAEYTLTPYEDLTRPWKEDTYYTRPGYRGPHRLDLALLRTCRLFYSEARHLSTKNATIALWYDPEQRGPPDHERAFMRRLWEHTQPQDSVDLHVFVQMYWLEANLLSSVLTSSASRPFQGRKITVTIRHTDWWFWEKDEPLHMKSESWATNCVIPTTVRTLCFEFETPRRKKSQLDAFVARVSKQWTFCQYSRHGTGRLGSMSAKTSKPIESSWVGPAMVDNRNHEPMDNTGKQPEQIDYYILTVTWRPVEVESAEGVVSL